MEAYQVATLVPAVVFLALGLWVFLLAPRRRLHRGFLLLMLAQAAYNTTAALAREPFLNHVFSRLFWYATWVLPWAVANFALVAWRARMHAPSRAPPLLW